MAHVVRKLHAGDRGGQRHQLGQFGHILRAPEELESIRARHVGPLRLGPAVCCARLLRNELAIDERRQLVIVLEAVRLRRVGWQLTEEVAKLRHALYLEARRTALLAEVVARARHRVDGICVARVRHARACQGASATKRRAAARAPNGVLRHVARGVPRAQGQEAHDAQGRSR